MSDPRKNRRDPSVEEYARARESELAPPTTHSIAVGRGAFLRAFDHNGVEEFPIVRVDEHLPADGDGWPRYRVTGINQNANPHSLGDPRGWNGRTVEVDQRYLSVSGIP